jgi:hypothetical protein
MINHSPIRLIALDLDGTTFNEKKEITPGVRSAIISALEQDVIVMPATGRPESGLPEAFLEIPGVKYALTSNGARIIDIHTKEAVYEDKMPLSQALLVLDYMAKEGYIPDFYIDGEVFVERSAYEQVLKTFDLGGLLPYFLKSRQPVENLREYVMKKGKPVEKINLMIQEQDKKASIIKGLRRLSSLSISSGLSTNIEVTSPTVNKGSAILGFAAQLGITKSEIMACGDSSNDLDMIKAVGLGVAMKNADKEIKTAASFITKSNEEDGVAYAIQKFVLKERNA